MARPPTPLPVHHQRGGTPSVRVAEWRCRSRMALCFLPTVSDFVVAVGVLARGKALATCPGSGQWSLVQHRGTVA